MVHIAFAVIIGLTVATMFAFVHAHSKRIAAEDHAASNARVLVEFKRIALHRPHFIVNNNIRRNHEHQPGIPRP